MFFFIGTQILAFDCINMGLEKTRNLGNYELELNKYIFPEKSSFNIKPSLKHMISSEHHSSNGIYLSKNASYIFSDTSSSSWKIHFHSLVVVRNFHKSL